MHVVYFWDDLGAGLREIARVMKPGARLGLVFRTAANQAAVRAFPSDVYRFPALEEIVAALVAAGFAIDGETPLSAASMVEPVLLVVTRSAV